MTEDSTQMITCFGCRRLLERQLGGSRLYWCRRFDPARAPARGVMRHGRGHPPIRETEDCWETAARQRREEGAADR